MHTMYHPTIVTFHWNGLILGKIEFACIYVAALWLLDAIY